MVQHWQSSHLIVTWQPFIQNLLINPGFWQIQIPGYQYDLCVFRCFCNKKWRINARRGEHPFLKVLTNVSTKAQLKTMLPIFDLEHLSSLGAITQNQVQIIESWPDMTFESASCWYITYDAFLMRLVPIGISIWVHQFGPELVLRGCHQTSSFLVQIGVNLKLH